MPSAPVSIDWLVCSWYCLNRWWVDELTGFTAPRIHESDGIDDENEAGIFPHTSAGRLCHYIWMCLLQGFGGLPRCTTSSSNSRRTTSTNIASTIATHLKTTGGFGKGLITACWPQDVDSQVCRSKRYRTKWTNIHLHPLKRRQCIQSVWHWQRTCYGWFGAQKWECHQP